MTQSNSPRTDAIHLGEQGAAGLLQDYYTLCCQLERELAGVKAEYANSIAAWTGINEEKERAEAALEEARRDAERWRKARTMFEPFDAGYEMEDGMSAIVLFLRASGEDTPDSAIDHVRKP